MRWGISVPPRPELRGGGHVYDTLTVCKLLDIFPASLQYLSEPVWEGDGGGGWDPRSTDRKECWGVQVHCPRKQELSTYYVPGPVMGVLGSLQWLRLSGGPVSMGRASSPRGVMDLTPGIYKLGWWRSWWGDPQVLWGCRQSIWPSMEIRESCPEQREHGAGRGHSMYKGPGVRTREKSLCKNWRRDYSRHVGKGPLMKGVWFIILKSYGEVHICLENLLLSFDF